MTDLVFISTMSIAAFKTAEKVASIEIVKSPKSGKLFFVAESITGAVSQSFSVDDVNAISVVHKAGDAENTFYLLHKKQSNNVIVLRTIY